MRVEIIPIVTNLKKHRQNEKFEKDNDGSVVPEPAGVSAHVAD